MRLVDQGDQAVAHFQAQGIDGHDVLPAGFFLLGRHGGWRHVGRPLGRFFFLRAFLADKIGGAGQRGGQQQEDHVRHAGNQAHAADDAGGDIQYLRFRKQLTDQLGADVLIAGHARDDDTGRRGNDQRRNLRHQAVTDGQQGVVLERIGKAHVMLQQAHQQAADDIDDGDHDAGDGVAAHVFAGTVHGAIEFRFLRHFRAAAARFVFADQAGVQIGIDGHLFTRHGVQREAGTHFGDTAGTLGHHGKVDDGQDDKHHDTDRVVAADQEVAERLDHFTGRVGARMAFRQHHARGRHVQRQAQHGRHQQNGREGHEVERLDRVQRRQQHDDGQRDIETEENVEDEGRQRQHHHRQQHDDDDRRGDALAGVAAHTAEPGWQSQAVHGVLPLFLSAASAAALICDAGSSGSSSGGTSSFFGLSGRWPWPLP